MPTPIKIRLQKNIKLIPEQDIFILNLAQVFDKNEKHYEVTRQIETIHLLEEIDKKTFYKAVDLDGSNFITDDLSQVSDYEILSSDEREEYIKALKEQEQILLQHERDFFVSLGLKSYKNQEIIDIESDDSYLHKYYLKISSEDYRVFSQNVIESYKDFIQNSDYTYDKLREVVLLYFYQIQDLRGKIVLEQKYFENIFLFYELLCLFLLGEIQVTLNGNIFEIELLDIQTTKNISPKQPINEIYDSLEEFCNGMSYDKISIRKGKDGRMSLLEGELTVDGTENINLLKYKYPHMSIRANGYKGKINNLILTNKKNLSSKD